MSCPLVAKVLVKGGTWYKEPPARVFIAALLPYAIQIIMEVTYGKNHLSQNKTQKNV